MKAKRRKPDPKAMTYRGELRQVEALESIALSLKMLSTAVIGYEMGYAGKTEKELKDFLAALS